MILHDKKLRDHSDVNDHFYRSGLNKHLGVEWEEFWKKYAINLKGGRITLYCLDRIPGIPFQTVAKKVKIPEPMRNIQYEAKYKISEEDTNNDVIDVNDVSNVVIEI